MALCDPLTEGYAAHLTKLSAPGGSVPAQGNARMVIPRFGFSSGKQSQEKFSELASVSLDSSNTSRCRCAIALNSPCEPTRKSKKDRMDLQFKRKDLLIPDTTQPLHQQLQQRHICLKRRERSLWSEQQLDERQDKALRPSLWRNLHLLASWLQFLLNIWFWYLAKKGWRAVCLLCKNGSLWISRFEAMHCNVVPVENAICWSLIYFFNQNLLKYILEGVLKH